MSSDFVPVMASAPGLPQTFNLPLTGFLDADPEQYPEGVELIIMRPGNLTPQGTITVPRGGLLLYCPPEAAQHLREKARKEIAAQREAMARRGHVGRRG